MPALNRYVRAEFSENPGLSRCRDLSAKLLLKPFSQEGLEVMSHDVAAIRVLREAPRRKVSYHTSIDDLEGQRLCSREAVITGLRMP